MAYRKERVLGHDGPIGLGALGAGYLTADHNALMHAKASITSSVEDTVINVAGGAMPEADAGVALQFCGG